VAANFSTATCPQRCLDPVTAFQLQNFHTCLNEVASGLETIAANLTDWNPVVELVDNCMTQYCSYLGKGAGGCPYEAKSADFCSMADVHVNPELGGVGVGKIVSISKVVLLTHSR
jgi:hypothetical protein